jgi:hypothetical protein
MIDEIYDLLKGAAVDCTLNISQNNVNTNNKIKCFKFPENKINEPAFKLISELNKENINKNTEVIKLEEKTKFNTVLLSNGTKLYYKVINDFNSTIPAEKKIYKIKNESKYMQYANKSIMLFPMYNEQALEGILITQKFGHIAPNSKIQIFPLNAIL